MPIKQKPPCKFKHKWKQEKGSRIRRCIHCREAQILEMDWDGAKTWVAHEESPRIKEA